MFNMVFNPKWSTLKKLIWLKAAILSGVASVIHTVTGNAPITLSNAVAKAIKSLTQTGLCTQASTPTPSAPVDIKCNNGKIMFVSEGVPSEYVKLEYLEATDTQYIDTGLLVNPQTQYVYRITPTTGSWFGGFTMGSQGRWGISINVSSGVTTLYSDSTTCQVTIPMSGVIDILFDFGVGITYNGNTINFPTTPTRPSDGTGYLFKAQGSSAVSGSKIYYFAIYQSGNKVQELIPCRRRADGVLGMYDTVTNTFFTNAGTGTFIAGKAVGQVEVVGTPEVLTVGEQTASVENLFKIAANNYYADYTDEQNIISGIVTRKVGVKVLNGTEDWGYSSPVHTVNILDAVTTELRKTPLLCTHYPIIDDGRSFSNTPNDTMFFTAGKALGIKDSNKTSEQMKAWLAAQYDAGTPVIVLYPLAEATTESVEGQALHTVEGTNVVSVTAEVSPVELECEYYATE